jgi:hypothetical protein
MLIDGSNHCNCSLLGPSRWDWWLCLPILASFSWRFCPPQIFIFVHFYGVCFSSIHLAPLSFAEGCNWPLVQRSTTLALAYNFYRRFELNSACGEKSACPTKKPPVKINFHSRNHNRRGCVMNNRVKQLTWSPWRWAWALHVFLGKQGVPPTLLGFIKTLNGHERSDGLNLSFANSTKFCLCNFELRLTFTKNVGGVVIHSELNRAHHYGSELRPPHEVLVEWWRAPEGVGPPAGHQRAVGER